MDEAGELCPLICFSMFKGHSIRYIVTPMGFIQNIFGCFYYIVFPLLKDATIFSTYYISSQPILLLICYITLINNFLKKFERHVKIEMSIFPQMSGVCVPAILLSFGVCFVSNFAAIHPTDLTAVGQLVRRHVPEAVFLECIGQEITYILPYGGARDGTFALLFHELDLAIADLGLTSYGISDTTLEEVH